MSDKEQMEAILREISLLKSWNETLVSALLAERYTEVDYKKLLDDFKKDNRRQ